MALRTTVAHAPNRLTWPLGLIGTLALIGAVERFRGRRACQPPDASCRDVLAGRTAPRPAPKDARTCSAWATAGSSWDCCRGCWKTGSGSRPITWEYWEARHPRATSSCARCSNAGSARAILVDFSESLLRFSPSRNAACLADWLGRRESLEVAWHRDRSWPSRPRCMGCCLVGATIGIEVRCCARLSTRAGSSRPDDPVFLRNWQTIAGRRSRANSCRWKNRRDRGAWLRTPPMQSTLIGCCG